MKRALREKLTHLCRIIVGEFHVAIKKQIKYT